VQNDVVDNIILDGHADYVVKTLVGHTEGFTHSPILLSLAEFSKKKVFSVGVLCVKGHENLVVSGSCDGTVRTCVFF